MPLTCLCGELSKFVVVVRGVCLCCFFKYKYNKLQAEFSYNATAAAAASPPPRRFTVHHPRTAAAAVNRRPPRVVSPPLPSSSARACARATPTHTLTSAAVVVAAAAAVVAAAADVADAGARTRTWRGEWERGNWSLAANVRVDVSGKSR